MPRHSLSNSHFSTDYQSHDVLQWLKDNAPKQYEKLNKDFEGDLDRIKFTGSHYDTDAMEVDIEWGSWLVDAIEQLDIKEYEHDDGSKGWSIFWEDGEPWLERLPTEGEIYEVVISWFSEHRNIKSAVVGRRVNEAVIDFLSDHVDETPDGLIDFVTLLEAGFMIGYNIGHKDGSTIFSGLYEYYS